jgi:hypothetical protein
MENKCHRYEPGIYQNILIREETFQHGGKGAVGGMTPLSFFLLKAP